jgi:SpoVK/Ycf46/Vps4 family AAA+-type ATPase
VIVLAATNTPWFVDKAFLREGRFDRVVHVGLPTLEERVAILRVHIQRMKCQANELPELNDRCEYLAKQTEGFSGADLAALCREAAIQCLLRKSTSVADSDFESALRTLAHPSSSAELVDRNSKWKP